MTSSVFKINSTNKFSLATNSVAKEGRNFPKQDCISNSFGFLHSALRLKTTYKMLPYSLFFLNRYSNSRIPRKNTVLTHFTSHSWKLYTWFSFVFPSKWFRLSFVTVFDFSITFFFVCIQFLVKQFYRSCYKPTVFLPLLLFYLNFCFIFFFLSFSWSVN